MGEMIERVKAAIRDAQSRPHGEDDVARAAVEAMREPTAQMLAGAWAAERDANGAAQGSSFSGTTLMARKKMYEAMIDEALKPAAS